ncbi:potassium channel family protein [Aeromicrobium fastidiosum]|uniref:Two pore domain potassium channel family protein n=1 Tax=Aeromicrobium fastidiosum TaxID=52699 RepID=A0A641AN61_9ACTN|nr:potassium channel family protein [Aeromicrobium fastidiosum]KAA1376364.1 two pore domain potassium channel family protein [Aeromicrobium fastidiosum]MBP2391735.1 voltage-gated potassium channel [Aeromicrobium fastidiosum]
MSRVERWERRSEIPLLLLAVAFLTAYAWPVLDPRLDTGWREFFSIVSWTVWVAFAVDFIARLSLADRRGEYAISHWYDVVLIAVPMLRPLRLLRLLALVRIMDRSASNTLAVRALVYVSGSAVAAVLLGAVAVLDAERDASGANISSFGDAVWWACATVTTIGYGDFYPVSTEGRAVAVVLMVVGIGVVGAITGAVATAMMTRAQHERADS